MLRRRGPTLAWSRFGMTGCTASRNRQPAPVPKRAGLTLPECDGIHEHVMMPRPCLESHGFRHTEVTRHSPQMRFTPLCGVHSWFGARNGALVSRAFAR